MTEEAAETEGMDQQEELSVGAQLRAARERCGYELRDIAQKLKLDTAVIIALENDNYERLPEPIFVCGYLRAYANHVSIPSDPLVEAFTNRGVAAPPITRQKPVKAQVNSRNKHVRGVSYGLVLVLLMMLVTWWRSNNIDITETAPVPVAEKESVTIPVQVATEPKQAVVTTTDVTAASQTSVPSSPVKQETITVESQAVTLVQPDKTPAAVIEPAADTPAGPVSRVVMVFSADSWLEVEDARGNKLEYDLMREGRRRELSGIAPFKVFLGNAPAVEIEYNGEPFDHAPYVKGNLAHFRIGGSGGAITDEQTASD